MKETKQVIVWRKDLKCRKGKMMAQAAHASLKAILDLGHTKNNTLTIPLSAPIRDWIDGRFTKIAVYVENEKELLEIFQKARDNNIISSLITDAGLTEFGGVPTITCCAIGPGYKEDIDSITGHLNLL